MSLFEDVMQLAVQLPTAERERLAQALGVKPQSSVTPPTTGQRLPLHQFAANLDPSKTNPVAWRKAETGHAVLATAANDVAIAPGPEALAGIWQHLADAIGKPEASSVSLASSLPTGSPVLVHTTVCTALALGEPEALEFFQAPPVEIRLATATYLALLGAAENEEQQRRIRAFVQPYAVLSLGPMASSRSVELMFAHGLENDLSALDALIAATALAHEIPLVTRDPRNFQGIDGLHVVLPYADEAAEA